MKPLYLNYCSEELDEKGCIRSFSLHVPKYFNFANDVVDVIAQQEPDKTALIWRDHKGREEIFSFLYMSKASARAANYLTKQGIRRGDRVLLLLRRHFEYWYTLLALHRIGAVAIPASYMLREEDLIYRIQSASIKAIVCTEDSEVTGAVTAASAKCGLEQKFTVRQDCPGFLRLDTGMEKESDKFSRKVIPSTDPMIMYFTSGTTGYPKAVVHNYGYPLGHIPTAKYWQNTENNGVHLSVADTGWAKASWGKIYGQWLCGSAVLVYDYINFNPGDLLEVAANYKVCSFCAPPTFYRFLVKSGLKNYNFSTLHSVSTAGEALNPDIFRKFQEHTGLEIKEGYGQTETTLIIGNFQGEKSREGSMGKPSPLYRVQIVDEEGQPVPQGETGEIVILPNPAGNFGLMDHYDKDPEATEEIWKNGMYHTRDLAYQDKDGYIWYVGRTDDVIKSCGYRISPFEVENVLIQHPAVFECAVTGIPDAERGFAIKATVVLQPGYEGTRNLTRQLQKFVKESTASYKYPRIIEYVPVLPKTDSGKIQRFRLRKTE